VKVSVVVVLVVVAAVLTSLRFPFRYHHAFCVLRIHRLHDLVLATAVLYSKWIDLSPDNVSATST